MEPALHTYREAAALLERRTTGLKLAGWTLARSALIFTPLVAVRVPWKRAAVGSLLASALITTVAVLRIRAVAHAAPTVP